MRVYHIVGGKNKTKKTADAALMSLKNRFMPGSCDRQHMNHTSEVLRQNKQEDMTKTITQGMMDTFGCCYVYNDGKPSVGEGTPVEESHQQRSCLE